MDWSKCNWSRCVQMTLVIFLGVITISKCDNSVHILSKYRQHITSSTLNWLTRTHYEKENNPSKENNLVIGGFQDVTKSSDENDNNEDPSNPITKQRPMYVCRAVHSGVWVAGTQLEGEKRCTVTFLGNVQTFESYDLLENVESAARLSWLAWDKFHQIPSGAVATDTMYVARHVVSRDKDGKDSSIVPAYTHYIGTLDHTDKLGKITYVKDNGLGGLTVSGEVESGEVLVETEPLYYELTSIKLNRWRKRIIKNESITIGEATISNSRNEGAKLAQAFGYKYKYFSYWGQGHGMIKALNTSITLFNKTRLPNIKWGMDERSEREDTYSVEIYLEPGTGVNVTVKANYMDFEVPYTGQLVSHYEDGESKSREINLNRREETMVDLKPEFGPIYFLSNLSIVPTTVAPLTTRGMTSTVISSSSSSTSGSTSGISSTTTNTNNHHNNNVVSNQDDQDDNMIIPPRKSDNSNIQGDDGGPLSLKNKEESNDGASNTLTSCLPVFITSLSVILYRIT